MKMSNSITPFALLLVLFSVSHSTSTPNPIITLPLSQLTNKAQAAIDDDIYQHLNDLATISLARAHHLKNPRSSATTTTTKTTSTPLFPHSYGAYTISLKFGTPPQTLPLIMDSGSSLVWFPCTHHYVCNDCSTAFSSQFFVPKMSSTAKVVGCLNSKCGWLNHNSNIHSRCPDCSSSNSNCSQPCPPYLLLYGSGSTGGLALLDTLSFNSLNNNNFPDFFVGCSLFSSHMPTGIAGFGRGNLSLPTQLGLTKFSYCMLSHRLDDSGKSSSLNLTANSNSHDKVHGVSYTHFLTNPNVTKKDSFSVYYYLGLHKIMVGGKRVKIPHQFLSPPDTVTGDGGTIVDSGTTLTYMGKEIFEPLAREMQTQVTHYERATHIENITGLRPCFNVSGFKTVSLPSLRFKFKGGAEMAFPLENYFSVAVAKDAEAVCMTIVTDPPGQGSMIGPNVILGNMQQQNFYLEYDLKDNKFGFKQQICS